MKSRLLIFLMLFGGGYFLAEVSFVAAQQQIEKETAPAAQVLLRLAQAEQPKPERPIKQLLPGAGTILKQQVAPPPPPEPWYKNSTVLVAIISALSAITVAVIGLLKRGG